MYPRDTFADSFIIVKEPWLNVVPYFCPSLPVKLEVKINSGEGYLLHLNVNHEWKIGRYQNKVLLI